MTRLSVLIPTYNRPRELRLCLEGFAAQSAPRDSFEVIVIDDGSTESVEPLVMEFAASINVAFRRIANAGPSVARNLAVDEAAAPLLLLYDDDLRPRPGAIDFCLRFHETWPDEAHASLLSFRPDPSIRDLPLIRWAFDRMYPFPAEAGIYDWGRFWSGTLTCKKSLFRFGRFSPEFRVLEDAELALRLSRRVDLRVHFERRVMGVYTHPLSLPQYFARSYLFGYYDYRLARKYPGAYGRDAMVKPEELLIPSDELRSLMTTSRTLLAASVESDSPKLRLLSALLTRADLHARAEGSQAARDGGSPDPPGTVGLFLHPSSGCNSDSPGGNSDEDRPLRALS